MMNGKRRPLKWQCLSISLIFLCVQFFMSCGGGGGSSNNQIDETKLEVSASSLYPGQFMTVEHPDIQVGTPLSVTFSNAETGYEIILETNPKRDNSLLLQIPPYLDSSGSQTEGSVTLSLSVTDDTTTVDIKDAVPIEYDDAFGEKPGIVIAYVLDISTSFLMETLMNLDAFSVDTASFEQKIWEEIVRFQNAIAYYNITGTFTMDRGDGTSHNLTEEELRFIDQWLYASAVGTAEALEARGVTSTKRLTILDTPIRVFDEGDEIKLSSTQKELLIWANRLKNVGDAPEVAMGGLTLAGGILGAIAGGVTAPVIAAGIALGAAAYFVVVPPLAGGCAWLGGRIEEQVLGSTEYEAGAEIINRCESGLWYTFTSGLAAVGGTVFKVIDLASAAYTVFTGEIENMCETENEVQSLPIETMATISDMMTFCNEVYDSDYDNDGYTENEGDCNDSNPKINSHTKEICGDGIDNDCDGMPDCYDSDCYGDAACQDCTDNDGDGYYVETDCGTKVDCNDGNSSIHPDAAENCSDQLDNDCDGLIDCDDALDCGDHEDCEINPYTGSLSGTWGGDCFGAIGGSFSFTISESGAVTGSFSGDESGSIEGTVSHGGSFQATGSGSAGGCIWSGAIQSGAQGLSGSGTWGCSTSCKGSWSGGGGS